MWEVSKESESNKIRNALEYEKGVEIEYDRVGVLEVGIIPIQYSENTDGHARGYYLPYQNSSI